MYTWVLVAPNANAVTRFLNAWRQQGTTWELVLLIAVFGIIGVIGIVLAFTGGNRPPV